MHVKFSHQHGTDNVEYHNKVTNNSQQALQHMKKPINTSTNINNFISNVPIQFSYQKNKENIEYQNAIWIENRHKNSQLHPVYMYF